MGIRFTCPQGHQLNVKSELAGKRGVCPQCGAKVQIPTETLATPELSEARVEPVVTTPAAVVTPAITPEVASPGVVAPVAEPAPTVVAAPPAAEPRVAEAVAVEEAWYVRPPGGGQFGPAARNDFAQWIRDGRVVPEAYVWRVGWADWRRAQEAASELPAALPVVAAAVVSTAAPIAATESTPVIIADKPLSPGRPQARRKKSAKQQLTLAILLLIVTAILGGVLWWVLTRTPTVPETTATYSIGRDVLG
jgi:hypothetical protein